MNIKFLDRINELRTIEDIKKKNFFLVVQGRRRIGKTTFLRKGLPNALYIFVWPNKSLEWIIKRICEENTLPSFTKFSDILDYLFDKHIPVILDEFQNFMNIDKSIYGEIQRLVDERKINNQFMQLAVAGSSRSMIYKVFGDSAAPLYGRRTAEISLTHLPLKDLFESINRPLKDFITLWAVFEGTPLYYEFLDHSKTAEENITRLLISRESLLQEEGKAILSIEFGVDSKTYNTVLMAIAEGKTRFYEISSYFSNKKNETVKYLDILRKNFKLVRRTTPLLSDPKKSKEGIYEITDNFLSFWFYFIDRQRPYLEQERFHEVELLFQRDFNTFVGKKFEKFVLELIRQEHLNFGFNARKVGRQFGRIIKGKKGEDIYEIDILSLNEQTKEILFAECKWKEKVNAKKIIKNLDEKTQFVQWNNEERKESFAIFAKSFSKRIDNFKGKRVFCFDLNDLEKLLK